MTQSLDDLEALTDGLSSPFWAQFQTHVTREWGPAGLRYQQAVREAASKPEAVVELQKILFAQEQILILMRWPSEKRNQLLAKGMQEMASHRRGGV